MIVYKEILQKLKGAGYNRKRLRSEKILSQSTIEAIRAGKGVSLTVLDRICQILNCPITELVEILPDTPLEKDGGINTENTPRPEE